MALVGGVKQTIGLTKLHRVLIEFVFLNTVCWNHLDSHKAVKLAKINQGLTAFGTERKHEPDVVPRPGWRSNLRRTAWACNLPRYILAADVRAAPHPGTNSGRGLDLCEPPLVPRSRLQPESEKKQKWTTIGKISTEITHKPTITSQPLSSSSSSSSFFNDESAPYGLFIVR